jgi:hypothetical protein
MKDDNKNKKPSAMPLAFRAEEALKKAVAKVIADHRCSGEPIAIWRDGKAVLVHPADLAVHEPGSKYTAAKKRK